MGEQLHWRKPRRSANSGGGCVEVAGLQTGAAVRDSKDRAGPMLALDRTVWDRFVDTVKTDGFDL